MRSVVASCYERVPIRTGYLNLNCPLGRVHDTRMPGDTRRASSRHEAGIRRKSGLSGA